MQQRRELRADDKRGIREGAHDKTRLEPLKFFLFFFSSFYFLVYRWRQRQGINKSSRRDTADTSRALRYGFFFKYLYSLLTFICK